MLVLFIYSNSYERYEIFRQIHVDAMLSVLANEEVCRAVLPAFGNCHVDEFPRGGGHGDVRRGKSSGHGSLPPQ